MTQRMAYSRRLMAGVLSLFVGGVGAADLMSGADHGEEPVRYDMAARYSLQSTAEGNQTLFERHTAAEDADLDPFIALDEHGVDVEPIRAVASRMDLDLLAIRLDLAGGNVARAVVEPTAKRCLTQAIYYEARGESSAGQMAVADVIMNRVDSPYYPDTVCGVVYQGSQRETGCQFSFTCDGSMERPVDVTSMQRSAKLADAVLSGLRVELTRGALNYHADYAAPAWADVLTRTAVVEDHIFYAPARYAARWEEGSSSGQ